MKVLFLNLPYKNKVNRRYMCSYNAHSLLYPPIELLSLAGIVKHTKNGTPLLVDAIGEDINLEQVLTKIERLQPDLIVSLTGFEIFEDDVNCVNEIKNCFPQTPYVLFGHYPTTLPEETLQACKSDFLMLGESDHTFSDLYEVIAGNKKPVEVNNVAYKSDKEIIVRKDTMRIKNINDLPLPAYELLHIDYYSEPYMPKPFTIFQSARGCPYTCDYCVKSYGSKLTMLTPENIIEHIAFMVDRFKIKSFRFVDDTFTAIPKRVVEICNLMIERGFNLKWSCLSRADTLNKEMLTIMKKAGCVRIFVGIESGSEKVLQHHKKKMTKDLIRTNIKMVRESGIKVTGLFMVGSPFEEESDFRESVDLALELPIDMVAVSGLSPYPGTPFYNTYRDKINFSLYPYENKFVDSKLEDLKETREKRFYKKFYQNPKKAIPFMVKSIYKEPINTAKNAFTMLSYLYKGNSSTDKRKDFI